jgi:nucleoside-diphosphate-sugar epimerase
VTTRVSVVGANGRVGSALVQHLADAYEVVEVRRRPGESPTDIAARAADGADVVINAAGVAHLEQPTPADLERLRIGNVELPLALAGAALRERAHLIHISSVKATADASTPYGQSKYEADRRLESEFHARFAEAGLSLVIVRPLALLFPPLNAGKVARLRFLRWWPSVLTPPVRLPVLAPMVFLETIGTSVDAALSRTMSSGAVIRGFENPERGTFRDVREAFVPR